MIGRRTVGHRIRDSGPYKECGFVDRDILAPTATPGRWTYRRVRAVAKPDVEAFIGTCAGFPQEDALFDWRQPDRFVACDCVRF